MPPRFFAVPMVLVLSLCAPRAQATVDFGREVRPLLNKHCTSCHGGVKRAGGLSFLSRGEALAEAKSGKRAIVPRNLEGSEILRRITSDDPDVRMPPSDHGPALEASEIEKLRGWIREGAPWTEHWAYERPANPPLPQVQDATWPKQGLDRFVLARLESEGIEPSRAAPRLGWLRRVSFDLTGLPPSEADAQAFLADSTAQAFEKVADRLLASRAYGERWASAWLDLARYADTMGYERDPNRTVWPWRDWVIRAFNDDLPYDRFVLRQLAGDLLPGATDDDRLATAFHRNTQTNVEDGTDDEEFRLAAVMDRISTTWEGLMATSFRCVQCHDHPYDAYAHEEYYKFAAYFNTTRDNDSGEDFPHLRVAANEADRPRLEELETRRKNTRRELHQEAFELAASTVWQPLRAESAKSTGQATMTVRESPGDEFPEVIASGTITVNSVYTIDLPRPPGGVLTALRLEGLPDDEEKARAVPELGFVISRFRLQLADADRSTNVTEIPLAMVYDDDPDSFFPAETSLHDDRAGWSAYPRFHHRRTAVFVPAAPVQVPEGSALRVVLAQNAQSSGITAQAMRRARFAASGEGSWTELLASHRPRLEKSDGLAKEIDAIPSVFVPVMADQRADQLRPTHVFRRGNWLDKGAQVTPGLPKVFGAAAARDRLEMARWLTAPEHPLFARVAVNRIWEQLFGVGLVESIEDFGPTGQPPSHPELLDWLATRFATELKFSSKKLLREIVLGAAYRQDSTVRPELLSRDPRNRLLARGPRQRLTAEMIRDQALAVGGLLSHKVGGPPVMPRQPEGIWRTVYNGGKWVTSEGEDAYRRAVYTFIRRTSGYPSFQTFDAPSRELCTTRRLPTNTPLQALVTLNDPVYLEAAAALARRMIAAGENVPDRIRRGWLLATGREAVEPELHSLLALHRTARAKLTGEIDPALGENAEIAALTVVANALLNLDLVLTR